MNYTYIFLRPYLVHNTDSTASFADSVWGKNQQHQQQQELQLMATEREDF